MRWRELCAHLLLVAEENRPARDDGRAEVLPGGGGYGKPPPARVLRALPTLDP